MTRNDLRSEYVASVSTAERASMRFVNRFDIQPGFPETKRIGGPAWRGTMDRGAPLRPSLDEAQQRPQVAASYSEMRDALVPVDVGKGRIAPVDGFSHFQGLSC